MDKLFKKQFLLFGLIGVIFIVAFSVVLLSARPKASLKETMTECLSTDKNSKTQCQLKNVEIILKDEGIDAALEEVSNLALADEKFLPQCHDFVHKVGQAAFKQFFNKEKFNVSSRVTMCSYGFYHGFMEGLLQTTGSYAQARDFCDYIDNQLKTQGFDLASECYHGIGHGIVGAHDPSLQGNASALTKQALDTCVKALESVQHQQQCASGVFNGIANAFTGEEFGLSMASSKDKPFELCVEQSDLFKETCYGFMARVLLRLSNNNFVAAVSKAENTVEKPYQKSVVANLSNLFASAVAGQPPASLIKSCRQLSEKSVEVCLGNAAIGLLQSGQPGVEYSKPFALCQAEFLNQKEQTDCFDRLLPELYQLYGNEKIAEVCNLLNPLYKNQCLQYNPNKKG